MEAYESHGEVKQTVRKTKNFSKRREAREMFGTIVNTGVQKPREILVNSLLNLAKLRKP